MSFQQLDRFLIKMEPLAARPHKFAIDAKAVTSDARPTGLSSASQQAIVQLVDRVYNSRKNQRPVMCAFGAHAIKNGLGPLLVQLIEEGWLTHLATNGAGLIHDWEFSYLGQSCEDVEQMVRQGRFGNWEETGFYINLALNVGAYQGKGYGEAVGAMIHEQGLNIPSEDELQDAATNHLGDDPQKSAAAADLLWVVRRFQIAPGRREIPHPWKRYSVQGNAYRLGVPLTGHPMFGHDIIYNHPMNCGAGLGRCAERDFLTFAECVGRLEGGVYISVGSAIMSPMIFEKSLSMGQNLALQRGRRIEDLYVFVVDLAECTWDWSQGEPPEEDPAYYLRYNKTFSRMGGTMRYVQADNRDFFLELLHQLDDVRV
jgi:hypothetical protein